MLSFEIICYVAINNWNIQIFQKSKYQENIEKTRLNSSLDQLKRKLQNQKINVKKSRPFHQHFQQIKNDFSLTTQKITDDSDDTMYKAFKDKCCHVNKSHSWICSKNRHNSYVSNDFKYPEMKNMMIIAAGFKENSFTKGGKIRRLNSTKAKGIHLFSMKERPL